MVKPFADDSQHKPVHLSLAHEPGFLSSCNGGSGWVLVGYMRVSTSEQNLALQRLLTLIYAMTAAKSYRAEVVLIPVLDIVQSVPILE